MTDPEKPNDTAEVKSDYHSDSVAGNPSQESSGRNVSKWLIFVGAGIVTLGVTIFAVSSLHPVAPAVAGLGLMVIVAAVGLQIASSKPDVRQGEGIPAGARSEVDIRVVKLAEELRRPSFRRREIFAVVCLTATPIVLAWLNKALWPLLGLVFPTVLVSTVILASLMNKYRAVKGAFILHLNAAERKEFLEVLGKRKPLERNKRGQS